MKTVLPALRLPEGWESDIETILDGYLGGDYPRCAANEIVEYLKRNQCDTDTSYKSKSTAELVEELQRRHDYLGERIPGIKSK